MRWLALLFLLLPASAFAAGGTCPASVPAGITSCYFADFVNGVDTAAGNSETVPLQHFPGMNGCASTCAGITPAAGEGFILRGGITWANAALGWYWTWSGTGTTSNPGCTGSGCIYIGVDPLWYTGGSWARPVLNAGGTTVAATGGGPANTPFGCYCNYIVFDNIEITGLYWTGAPAFGASNNIGLAGGSPGHGTNDTFEHLYIHGWSHNTYASGTTESPCGFTGDTGDPNNNVDTILEYSIISGADTDQASCNGAVFGSPPYVAYNLFEYVASAMVIDSPVTVHDNIIQNVVTSFVTTGGGTAHENGLEINFGPTATIYNNIFRHIGSGALTVWLAPDSTYTHYFFNNVVYDTDVGNVFDLAASIKTTPSGSVVAWNNTMQCGQNSNPNVICVQNINSAITAVTLQNNHFITSAGSYWSTNGPTPTLVTNLLQTPTNATSQGYTESQTYAFSPTAAYPTNSTPGQGTSATLLCTASGAGAPCGLSTTYGVSYNATNHTVASPGLTANTLNSTPDIGAYQFGSAASSPSCTPTSGAVPKTVTCTNPNSGTTVMCYAASPTVPATNGSGTGCTTGTQYTTALTISSPETLELIAGVAGESDSSVVSYTYTSATYTITVSSITGNGTVTSSDSVINCTTGTTGTCTDSTATGTITLTETPASGYSFTSWGGGTCSGSSSTCSVTTTATVTATFTANPAGGKTPATALLW